MSSGCQHVCRAEECDPVLHVSVCSCITCADSFNTAACLDFQIESGQPQRCSVTSQFGLRKVTKTDTKKWVNMFLIFLLRWVFLLLLGRDLPRQPSLTDKPPNHCWVDLDFQANYWTPLPHCATNTSNKQSVALVRTQKQAWHRIKRENILFHKEGG